MANKGNKELYERLRKGGVRKKTADLASRTASKLDGKGRVPKALKATIGELRGALDQLEELVEAHDRKAAGRKAAQTRRRKAQQRSAGTRTRRATSKRTKSSA
jgi:hypothetical protein